VYAIGKRALQFTNVTLTNNKASTRADSSVLGAKGGGMFALSGQPHLVNVTFHGNVAYSGGGAFFGTEAAPVIRGSTFSHNVATATGGGGLVCSVCRTISVAETTFSNNVASGYEHGNGGGALLENVLRGSGGVSSTSSSGSGADGAPVTWPLSWYGVQNCSFSGNRAEFAGGGLWIDGTSLNISYSTFHSNVADSSGGGAVFTTLGTPEPVGGDAVRATACDTTSDRSCGARGNCARFGCAVATPPQRLRVHGNSTSNGTSVLASPSPPGTNLAPALIVRGCSSRCAHNGAPGVCPRGVWTDIVP